MLSEQSNTVNDGRRSKPSVWECSEVIFRDAEKRCQADIRTRKPRSTLRWRQSAPDGRRLGIYIGNGVREAMNCLAKCNGISNNWWNKTLLNTKALIRLVAIISKNRSCTKPIKKGLASSSTGCRQVLLSVVSEPSCL